ncbi:hypothetical protein F5Y15DRAFT_30385 [Xylariaceae sp. FL0016]|nr:hypothetical protein F5Y15DRAFT_30385 [Xylariaceae sp. FL0016]
MSQLSPLPTNLHRSHSAVSVAASDTTYHSSHDIEPTLATALSRVPSVREDHFQPKPIRRHDSGYESVHSASRSGASHSSHRRSSTISSHSSQLRTRARPSMRRATKSTPSPQVGRLSGQPIHLTMSQQHPNGYYYFPSPESMSRPTSEDGATQEIEEAYPPPPQTTHYWTSDYTRRLEYAAIDAASQGVKGWILKHVVPDCFVPKENRRLGFDDDTGSVRRYRLDLDCDDSGEKDGNGPRKMGWLFGR